MTHDIQQKHKLVVSSSYCDKIGMAPMVVIPCNNGAIFLAHQFLTS